MSKTYKLKMSDGSYSDPITYNEICHRLNISPESKFIKITASGTVGCTAGKISELKYALRNIINAKYTPTVKLLDLLYK